MIANNQKKRETLNVCIFKIQAIPNNSNSIQKNVCYGFKSISTIRFMCVLLVGEKTHTEHTFRTCRTKTTHQIWGKKDTCLFQKLINNQFSSLTFFRCMYLSIKLNVFAFSVFQIFFKTRTTIIFSQRLFFWVHLFHLFFDFQHTKKSQSHTTTTTTKRKMQEIFLKSTNLCLRIKIRKRTDSSGAR